ncbi:MAG: arginase family protein [Verrucomicrobiaceae bacterium]
MSLEILPPTSCLFLRAHSETFSGVPALLGIPFGKGTDDSADVTRAASQSLKSYSPASDADLADILFTDYGNLVLKTDSAEDAARIVGDATRAVLGTGATPILFGGDGSPFPGAVRATLDRYPNLVVIQISASPKLGSGISDKWHPGSATARILDRLPGDQLLQLGMHEGLKKDFEEMREENRLVTIKDLPDRLDDSPVYLSLDLDVFESSLFSATGIHEPGGLLWRDFEALLDTIPWAKVKGIDFSGLVPDTDLTGYSSLASAKILREFILRLPQPEFES